MTVAVTSNDRQLSVQAFPHSGVVVVGLGNPRSDMQFMELDKDQAVALSGILHAEMTLLTIEGSNTEENK